MGLLLRAPGMKTSKARLTAHGPGGAWTFLKMPYSVEKEFGTKARVAVAKNDSSAIDCGQTSGFPKWVTWPSRSSVARSNVHSIMSPSPGSANSE
jgi:hypothetical protein